MLDCAGAINTKQRDGRSRNSANCDTVWKRNVALRTGGVKSAGTIGYRRRVTEDPRKGRTLYARRGTDRTLRLGISAFLLKFSTFYTVP